MSRKATEWLISFDKHLSPSELTLQLQRFIEEISDIADQRGGTPGAVEGAIKEQFSKWQAICRQMPELTRQAPGFDQLMARFAPKLLKVEKRFLTQPQGKKTNGKPKHRTQQRSPGARNVPSKPAPSC